jgi:hypothetical protein
MLRALRYFCWLYIALIVAAIIADVVIALAMPYGGGVGAGCNFTDALVIGVKCQNFAGADAVGLFLNWPLLLVYAPMFAFSSLWMLVPAVLLWLPPIYLLASLFRKRHAT